MASRDQQRAALAFQHVSAYDAVPDARKKKYATMVHKLPALLQSAGLCQALHFACSRSDGDSREIVAHLAEQIAQAYPTNPGGTDAQTLLDRCRKAPLGEYLALTDEVMACAAWYRRMVQGVLKIEASDADGDA